MKNIFCYIISAALALQTPGFLLETGGTDLEPESVSLPIVMYHHMSEKEELLGEYVLSVAEFEEDLKYLKNAGYESVTLAQLLAWYEGRGRLPEKPVMITFDDGYESTAVYAGPLLEEYGFTAIVAVIGSVAQFFTDARDHNLDYAHLNWEGIKELAGSGVFEIQCHTWDMHKLRERHGCGKMEGEDSEAYAEALREDLKMFETACADNGVKTCGTIAFPFGTYSSETISLVREMGYKAAFTCSEKINILVGNDAELFDLGRYNRAHGYTSEAFFSGWK